MTWALKWPLSGVRLNKRFRVRHMSALGLAGCEEPMRGLYWQCRRRERHWRCGSGGPDRRFGTFWYATCLGSAMLGWKRRIHGAQRVGEASDPEAQRRVASASCIAVQQRVIVVNSRLSAHGDSPLVHTMMRAETKRWTADSQSTALTLKRRALDRHRAGRSTDDSAGAKPTT